MTELAPITVADVRAAAARIAGHVHRTPVITSRTFDAELGGRVFFKCENLQRVGAFKARGATNAVQALDAAAAARGVITHSSGNHGAAVAWAASVRGIPAIVVVPDDAPPVKVAAIAGYGAQVVRCRRDQREPVTERLLAETGATLVHPYEDPLVVAGQGTAALELIEDIADLDLLITPLGGGGLLTGTAVVARSLLAGAQVLGAEPAAVDDAHRSLRDGVHHPAVSPPRSIADGLLTRLGTLAFALLGRMRVEVVTVGEDEIAAAAIDLLQRTKLVVEPSGAVVLAALRKIRGRLRGQRVGAILSGGNTDFAWMPRPLTPGSA